MTYREEEERKNLRFDAETRQKAWISIPRKERELLREFVQAAGNGSWKAAEEALTDYLVTRYRASAKAARDAARDREARVLVGARIPREMAAAIKRRAEEEGISVYRWCYDALENRLDGVPF